MPRANICCVRKRACVRACIMHARIIHVNGVSELCLFCLAATCVFLFLNDTAAACRCTRKTRLPPNEHYRWLLLMRTLETEARVCAFLPGRNN